MNFLQKETKETKRRECQGEHDGEIFRDDLQRKLKTRKHYEIEGDS